MRAVRASDFDFDLPADLIAQFPLPDRTASRLLVVDGVSAEWRDAEFRELGQWLRPGDLLVFNDTRVIPARLHGRKPTGGSVEMLLERALEGQGALLHMRASKPLRDGSIVETAGGPVRVLGRQDDLFRVELPEPALAFFGRYGEIPLPPYIARETVADDTERYQSVLARVPGAVAAPTASLHFDHTLLERLSAAGVERATILWHVGAGTFQPLRSDNIDDHVMHAEYAEIPLETATTIARVRAAGGRVIAVGTTVVRALESAAMASADGVIDAWSGETRIFIRPGHRFRAIDALITNFHLPKSTLLMLVSAFVGRETMLAAYAHAIKQRYRFFSYGDAMLLTPASDARS